ncbi:MAG: MFS transporter, partial [Sphingobacteriales bacterium]
MFLIGSILCGLSQSLLQLIIFRALQGIGSGAIMVNSIAIIGDLFPPSERGKWQGIIGAVFGIASISGPIMGGVISEIFGWRWIFFINIPFAILSITLIKKFLQENKLSKIKQSQCLLIAKNNSLCFNSKSLYVRVPINIIIINNK